MDTKRKGFTMNIKKLLLATLTTIMVGGILFNFQSSNKLNAEALTTTVISPSNIRIWFAPGRNWRQGGASFRLENTNSSPSTYYPSTGIWYNSLTLDIYSDGATDWQMFVYFDVPKTDFADGTTFKFLRYSNDSYTTLWNYGASQTYTTGHNSQVYYYPFDWWDDGTASRDRPDNVDSGLATLAIAGYLTCENNSENGFSQFNEVAHTWIDSTLDSWNNSKIGNGNLEDHSITDYSGVGSVQYSSSRNDSTVSALNKYLRLKGEFLD